MLTLGVLATLPALLSRCTFLAPTRLGGLFYYPNVLDDASERRLKLPRQGLSLAALAAGLAVCGTGGALGVSIAVVLLLTIAALELGVRLRERRILTSSWAPEDSRWEAPGGGPRDTSPRGSVPHPSHHPVLTVRVDGPFVRRLPRLDLGDLATGRRITLKLLVANHSIVPAQVPLAVAIVPGARVQARIAPVSGAQVLGSGAVSWFTVEIEATASGGPDLLCIDVTCGSFRQRVEIRVASVSERRAVTAARVTRYPGGRRSAFAWRGDMDLYDTASFQSIEGLRETLGLAARYRVPQTMFLSTRLTLDQVEADAYYEHYGAHRGQADLPAFVSWVKENVDIRHSAPYPFEASRPYLLELGNHMHLHYGTDASAAPGNGWRRGAGIGAGQYPWTRDGATSFEEQRDNALECRRRIEGAFAFSPRSWAMPDSTRDAETPRAVEAAGCDVLSDSDGRHSDNVLFQPPPHHPVRTRAVELTKRFPGDPETLIHAEMVRFWIHRAHRLAIPVVFMCHQHMRQFAGTACTRFTEWTLRHALTDFNGDLYVDTVWGIGNWWRSVLSPVTGAVSVSVSGGEAVVANSGPDPLHDVPVDLALASGGRATVLVDLAAREKVTIQGDGTIRRG